MTRGAQTFENEEMFKIESSIIDTLRKINLMNDNNKKAPKIKIENEATST